MPKPSQERIAELIEMLLEILDATDLDDDEADEVCEILLSKMWQRSGLETARLPRTVCAVLPDPDSVPLPVRRY
jgi:hypothetical protein